MTSIRRIRSARPPVSAPFATACLALFAGKAFAAEPSDLEPPSGLAQPAQAAAPAATSAATPATPSAAPAPPTASPAPSVAPPASPQQRPPSAPPPGFLPPAVGAQLGAPGMGAASPVNDASTQNPSEVAVPRRSGLGLRLAYSNPGGNAWAKVPQKQMTKGMLRVQGDFEYAVLPNLMGGFYGALGIGAKGDGLSDSCKSDNVSCSVFGLDLGVQANVLVLPTNAVDPWFGFAAGFDMLSVNVDEGSYDESITLYGPAFTLSGGVDIDVGPVVIGPYVAYQLGWYTTRDVSNAYSSNDDDQLDDIGRHSWLTIGLRGSFSLN